MIQRRKTNYENLSNIATRTTGTATATQQEATSTTSRPETMSDMDDRDNVAWMYSFVAAMVPFSAFCYGHQRGATGRIVERVVKSPVGVYGLLALPFVSLGMEKSIYDTVQAWQGIDPNVRPKDRGGFPSGGAELPSFSLIPVQKRQTKKLFVQRRQTVWKKG